MKTIKLLTMAALCGSSISPLLIAAPAMAQSATTASTMAGTCTADLGANAAVLLHDGSPSFATEVVQTGEVDGAPSEVPGSRVETPGSRFGTGSATYSNLAISGNPFRTGGSVNMFGDQVATLKHWANSEYDFTAQYATLTTFSYQCQVTQQTETYHPAVHIPGHPVLGYYIVDPDTRGNEEAAQNSCNAFNAQAPIAPDYNAPGFWGVTPHGNCIFVKTADAVDPVDEPEYWTLDAPLDRTDLLTSHTVDETNYASGNGHEANAGPWTQSGSWLAAKVVICISPKKLPGIWTKQNGYLGDKCTTSWFNVAPWGGGSQTSNGTYISVPGV
jgi:hypothetical protein